MSVIGGITFCDDYDKFNFTEKKVDRMKLKLFYALTRHRMDKIWRKMEQERPKIPDFSLDDEDVMYFDGLGETFEEEPEDTKNIDELLDLSYIWLAGFDEEHRGDCTKDAFTCTRCYVERLIGVDTTGRNLNTIKE